MNLGCVALDFSGTILADGGALGPALTRTSLLDSAPAIRPEDLDEAQRLQSVMARCFRAAIEGSLLSAQDVATLNSYAADETPTLVLRSDGSASRSAVDPVRAAFAAIARDAIETIAYYARDLRICADANCERTFLDRSRGKRRRWCSMQTCGNRAKIAAFRSQSF